MTRSTTHAMFDPHAPPDGTSIEQIDERGVVILQWREAKRPPARWLAIVLAWTYAFGLTAMAFALFLSPEMKGMPIHMKLFALGFAALMVGALALPLLIPRKPESLTFDGDILRHDTGSPPLPGMFMLFLGPMTMQLPQFFGEPISHHWQRRQRTMSRQNFGPIRLERVGQRQRLTIDLGADRIEIGPSLREPEREWLADVLQEWKANHD